MEMLVCHSQAYKLTSTEAVEDATHVFNNSPRHTAWRNKIQWEQAHHAHRSQAIAASAKTGLYR